MAVITCTDIYAGRESGYDANSYNNSPEAREAHIAEAHQESYVGAVLALGEHNLAHDSYFYALVWDDKAGEVIEIETGSTAYANHGYAQVDATPSVIRKAVAWRAAQLVKEIEAKHRQGMRDELTRVEVGMQVKSLTTRGKNKGVVGKAKVIKPNSYGPGWVAGVEVEGEANLRWIEVTRLAPVNAPKDMDAASAPTAEERKEIEDMARRDAEREYARAIRLAGV